MEVETAYTAKIIELGMDIEAFDDGRVAVGYLDGRIDR